MHEAHTIIDEGIAWLHLEPWGTKLPLALIRLALIPLALICVNMGSTFHCLQNLFFASVF
jgi:hypothetical protein